MVGDLLTHVLVQVYNFVLFCDVIPSRVCTNRTTVSERLKSLVLIKTSSLVPFGHSQVTASLSNPTLSFYRQYL